MTKHRLSKYERETILLTSEADDTWEFYTFNQYLRNKLKKYAARYPDLCRLKEENKKYGYVSYIIEKSQVSIHLNSPYSEDRRKNVSESAKKSGIHNNHAVVEN